MNDIMKKLAYLTRIKDEEDLIFYQLSYYYNQGIRNFYVTFNNSNQETRKAVNDFAVKRKDIILYEFEETSTAYNQIEIFNEMSDVAFNNGHVWQVPSDADEFLFFKKGSLLQLIKKYDDYDYGYINFRWVDYMSTHADDDTDPNYFTRWKYREPHPRPQTKIIYKWSIGCKHGHGHHLLIQKRIKMDEISMDAAFFTHFPNRSREQMKKKMIRVGEAFSEKYGKDNVSLQVQQYKRWLKDGDAFIDEYWDMYCRERKENFERYVLDPINPKIFIA